MPGKRRLGLTDNVVAVLISHQMLHGRISLFIQRAEGGHHFLPLLVASELDALLDDVAGELVLGVHDDMRRDDGNDLGSIFRPAMLDDVLRNVISVLIDDEIRSAGMQLFEQIGARWLSAVLKHSLDHPAAIGMRG